MMAAALASLAAYQAMFLMPVLAAYLVGLTAARVALAVGSKRLPDLARLRRLLTLLAVQIFERLSTGALPARGAFRLFLALRFQALPNKLNSALALSIHSVFIVCPILVPGAVIAIWRDRGATGMCSFCWHGSVCSSRAR